MLFKDWVTLSISIVALLISAVTAYFNIFLHTDDLTVLIEGYTRLTFDDKAKKLVPYPDYTMTFVNAGNQASSISRMYYSLDQSKGDDKSFSCQRPNMAWNLFVVEPFAVKANDLLIKKAVYGPGQWFENWNGAWNGDKLTVLVCLGFSAIAPNSSRKLISVEADRTVLDVKMGQPLMPKIEFDRDRMPDLLLKNWNARLSGLGFR